MKTAAPRLALLVAFAGVALAGTVGRDGGPTGAFTYSASPNVAAVQRAAREVVERYQQGLNSSNFAIIRPLFAPDAIAEWNDKATVIGRDAMAGPYQALFKEIKFATDFHPANGRRLEHHFVYFQHSAQTGRTIGNHL